MLLNPEFVLPEFCMHVQYLEDDNNNPSAVNQNELKSRSVASSSRKKLPNKIWIPSDLTYCNDDCDFLQEHQSGSVVKNSITNRKSSSLLSDRDDMGKLFMKNKLAINNSEINFDSSTYEANVKKENDLLVKSTEEDPQKNENWSPRRKSKSNNSLLRNKQMIVHDIENSTNDFNFERIKIFTTVIQGLENLRNNYSLEADRLQKKTDTFLPPKFSR